MENNSVEIIRGIQEKAAEQCAPVIYGIKPSNLLIIDQAYAKVLKQLIESTGLKARCFHHKTDKQVWFLFREDALMAVLNKEENRAFIRSLGYDDDMSLDRMFVILAERYRGYRNRTGDFPHELGIFLGYPVGDVKGFIDNKGRNCLFSGYWKVYENEQQARETFKLYAFVRQMAIELVNRGGTLGSVASYQFAV